MNDYFNLYLVYTSSISHLFYYDNDNYKFKQVILLFLLNRREIDI
jgi:hypothetical protein